ncbi:type I restriction endonuclease subunit R [Clostridium botulinum]|nr:type I restriction endonuclease subunit R [Clostridium botulinum]NFD32176.1 type I restriction endonuclease subunit R [Clostridium botulinum]NFD58083.1 type I restriction endonuclease subunit R [Clostridium botulinum]NFD99898.1 type I restriction endonuclease subunit R [Clostridium botulinum]
MSAPYNEDSRVKIPALVHFTRVGYEYVSLKNYKGRIDGDTNIFVDVFRDAINRINNTSLSVTEIDKIINEIKIILSGDDLGKAFYNLLLSGYNGLKFVNFDTAREVSNTYQVVTELTYKNENDEFRPDIIVLINGLPLSFIEVKKPNNKDGIQAEYIRINKRFRNAKFKRFVNITQLMVFSNNSEYDDNEVIPLEGVFYAASSYNNLFFSHFREEDESIFSKISPIDEHKEIEILKDTNLVSIKHMPEYETNLSPMNPTNRIITSLFAHDRIMFVLKYAIAYVERTNDEGITNLEKHLMRYPQLFATKAIVQKLNEGIKNGIIWHTQGSGKTALAYYNVRYLKDYYQLQRIIAKFYFVVDRLDLLTQAADEFRARGLFVEEVNSKEDFISSIHATGTTNNTGRDTITVINIQKFRKESFAKAADYNVSIQRIYFLDEAHRSYKPTGSFLANLLASDRNAVMVALTGTPLIGYGYNTKDVFGAYIHKYYYNRSIADRYTLKLIREGIETTYKKKLQTTLDRIETIKGSISKEELYAHYKYVKELVKYITEHFAKSRIQLNDSTIGGMIVCDSSKQARAVFDEMNKTSFSSALILHNEGDTDIRRQRRDQFKKGQIDFLIVYNMLLTGFDAPRLKKLYLCRVIKGHSLLQALTRVNRPYQKFRYGFVVDFADIRAEFDKTNKAYFNELQAELGDEFKQYDNIFKTAEEIEKDLGNISKRLFLYDTTNSEVFSQQISAMDDKAALIDLRHALELYKEIFNIAKLFGYEELSDKFDLDNINALHNEVNNRINLINLKQNLQNAEDMSAILNMALDEIDFQFKKISERELIIADKFRDSLERTRQEMQRNLDPKDLQYVSLMEELQRLLSKKHIEELNADEMIENIAELDRIRKAAERRNRENQMLTAKYKNDPKFMRTHKRLKETIPLIASDPMLHKILLDLKHQIDDRILSNERLLNNEPYFLRDMFPLIKQGLQDNGIHFTASQVKYIGSCISREYLIERNWPS